MGRNKVKIILDSNFLIDIFKFKIELKEIENILEEGFEICCLYSTIKELENIAKTRKKEAKHAKIALNFIKDKKIKVFYKGKDFDKDVLKLAKKEDFYVATNDKKLRKKLKSFGIKTIYVRGRSKLDKY